MSWERQLAWAITVLDVFYIGWTLAERGLSAEGQSTIGRCLVSIAVLWLPLALLRCLREEGSKGSDDRHD